MDIATLTAQALAFLTPYLVEGGKEITKEVGKDLWELVKSPFKSDKEKALIEELEKHPTNEKNIAKVEYVLSEKLESDSTLTEQLLLLIMKLSETQKVQNIQINQNHSGSGDNIAGNKIVH